MYFVTPHTKALRVKLNLHASAIMGGVYICVDVPNSSAQLHRLCINCFRCHATIIDGACMTQMMANIGYVKVSLLQFGREDLLLACDSIAKKADEYSMGQRNT